jgi:hypothetical protein
MKDKRLLLYSSRDIQERFCHLIRVSRSLGNPYIACCPPSLMVSGGLYTITKLIVTKHYSKNERSVQMPVQFRFGRIVGNPLSSILF